MDRFPIKMNIQQLSERSGYSAEKTDLLIQEGLVRDPIQGFMFSLKHQQELENIRIISKSGYAIECDRNRSYAVDRFMVR